MVFATGRVNPLSFPANSVFDLRFANFFAVGVLSNHDEKQIM